MFKRFRSFLFSSNKCVLLKAFLDEVKTDILIFYKRQRSIYYRSSKSINGKFNFSDQLDSKFGDHRSSWKNISNLRLLHNPHGTLADLFIERI